MSRASRGLARGGGWSLSLLWDVGGVRERGKSAGRERGSGRARGHERAPHIRRDTNTALWHTFTITFHFIYATALYSRAAGDAHSHAALTHRVRTDTSATDIREVRELCVVCGHRRRAARVSVETQSETCVRQSVAATCYKTETGPGRWRERRACLSNARSHTRHRPSLWSDERPRI